MTNHRTIRHAALLVGWCCMIIIVFSTLSPIEWRPHVAGAGMEHVVAFATVGLLFGLAHPRRLPAIALFLLVAAVSLEAAQHWVPGRHGRLPDLLQKIAGGGAGLAVAAAVNLRLARRPLRVR